VRLSRTGLLSKVKRIRGLGSSSGPWALAVGDMPIPALCPGHALALALPSTLPSTLSATSLSAGVVRGFIGTMRPPPTFRSDFGSSPSRTDPGPPCGCGRPEVSQVPTRSLTARTGLRWSGGPSHSGPVHVACGGSQRLGLHGKSLSELNTVLVVLLCTLRDHRRR
jgi:hypothetical protein